jgi:hypothetical protein
MGRRTRAHGGVTNTGAGARSGFVDVGDLASNEASGFAAIFNPSLSHLDYLFLNEIRTRPARR